MMDDDALTRALLMAGFGMIGAPTAAQGIARGGMFGVQAYDQALAMRDKRAEEAQQRQLRDMAILQAQQTLGREQARAKALQDAFAGGAPSTLPSAPPSQNFAGANPNYQTPPAAPAGPAQQPNARGAMRDMYYRTAQMLAKSGFGDDAQKFFDMGVKLEDEFSPEPRTLMVNGKPVTTLVSKQGNVKTLDGYAPKPDYKEVNLNNRVTFIDPLLGLTGPSLDTGISPAEKQRLGIEGARLKMEQDQTARGEYHEVPVEGGGARPAFVTPQGATFVPGTGEKKPEVPATIKMALAQNDVTLNKIDRALQMVDEQPQAFGAKNIVLPDAVRQRTDKEGVEARALVADIGSQKIHDRSGASVTANESPRLAPFVPVATDSNETIKKKLVLFQREYQQMRDELAGGKSLADVAAPKAPSTSRMPSIAELQAEAMRRGLGAK